MGKERKWRRNVYFLNVESHNGARGYVLVIEVVMVIVVVIVAMAVVVVVPRAR